MKRLPLVALALALPSCGLPAGCSGFDDTQIAVSCGDFDAFGNVSAVFEKRCGTIDCHGSMARPLRIYGRQGLRKPIDFNAAKTGDPIQAKLAAEVDAGADQYYPGGDQATTPSELFENYRAVCGLEPELTTLVSQGREQPEVLTVIRKMRLNEKHKGGKIFSKGDPGDKCITVWLTTPKPAPTADAGAKFDPADCNVELSHN